MIPAGSYLLIGRTGVGKSSLVNTIAFDSVSRVHASLRCTTSIEKYDLDSPHGSYTLYDTPGFCEDDKPETDLKYLNAIIRFLETNEPARHEVSLLLVARIGATRVRSEDYDVIHHLCSLILRFNLSVCFVATFADFSNSGKFVREQLDRARLQYLAMIDAELLKTSNKQKCATGFEGSYAVCNNTLTWLASPLNIQLSLPKDDVWKYYEDCIGHTRTFIADWLKAAGHDHSVLFSESARLQLLNGRIFNLTNHRSSNLTALPDFVSVPQQTDCAQQISCEQLRNHIDQKLVPILTEARLGIYRLFLTKRFFRDSNQVDILEISMQKAIAALLPIFSAAVLGEIKASYLAAIYSIRAIVSGFNEELISIDTHLGMLSPVELRRIIDHLPRLLFTILCMNNGRYLIPEISSFVEATLAHLDYTWNTTYLKTHLRNCLKLLYFVTVYAEWACFPRSDSVAIDCWMSEPFDILLWFKDSFRPTGYSQLMIEVLEKKDWRQFVSLAIDLPQCMPSFLVDFSECSLCTVFNMPKVLTGDELMSKVKELAFIPKSKLVRACGYVTLRTDGSERLNYSAFYEALLEARGVDLRTIYSPLPKVKEVNSHLASSWTLTTRVQFNGNLLVGKAYTSLLGLKPGDEFRIIIESRGFRLIPLQGGEFQNGNPDYDLMNQSELEDDLMMEDLIAQQLTSDSDISCVDEDW